MIFKLHVEDRTYTKFTLLNASTLRVDDTMPAFNPIEHKLFNQDIFDYDEALNIIIIQHSSARSMQNIPGVLVLEGNKRYGKYKQKFLYKCIPDDKRLPIFMTPYSIKRGFNKRLYNKYVIFKFNNWENKHPCGTLMQTLGDVTVLSNFYEYQLYCKSLYASIQNFTKIAKANLKNQVKKAELISKMKEIYNTEDRTDWDIITIDPLNSKDFDDAFGYKDISDNECCLSIYISNVSFWMDILDLWDSFSERIATIYLPDRKRPMLPTILSDTLCSLQENQIRFAFTLDIILDKQNMKIVDHSFKNTCIRVRKNFRYDTEEQEKDTLYQTVFKIVREMNIHQKYIDKIVNSHDLIAYLMILMNYISATYLITQKTGIFRSAKFNSNFVPPTTLPGDIQKFLKMWNSSGGQYAKHGQINSHDMLQLDAYVHITSPIRRLVDLLNIMIIQDSLNLMKLGSKNLEFYNKWTNDPALEYINKTMRSIRKVQNDCDLLNICATDKKLLDEVYTGFIFDKIIRNDKLYQYMVYLPKFKMVNRFISRYEKDNLTKQQFKLYVFKDENQLKHKIRVELQ